MRRWLLVLSAWGLVTALGAQDAQHTAITLRHITPQEAAVWLGCPLVVGVEGRTRTIPAWADRAAPVASPDGLTGLVAYELPSALIASGSPEALAQLRRTVARIDQPPTGVTLEAAVCRLRSDAVALDEPDALGWRRALLPSAEAEALLAGAATVARHRADTTTGQTTKVVIGRRRTQGGVQAICADVHLRSLPDGVLGLAMALGTSEALPVGDGLTVPVLSPSPPALHATAEVPAGQALVLVPQPTSAPLLPAHAVSGYAECPLLGPMFGRALPPGQMEALVLTLTQAAAPTVGATLIPLRFARPSQVAAWFGRPSAVLRDGRLVISDGPVPPLPDGRLGLGNVVRLPAGLTDLCGCDDLGALVATGPPAAIEELRQTIKVIDLPAKQVRIAATCALVPLARLEPFSPVDSGWQVLAFDAAATELLLRGAQRWCDASAATLPNAAPVTLALSRQAEPAGRSVAACLRVGVTPYVTGQAPAESVTMVLAVDGSSVVPLDGGAGAVLPAREAASLDTEVRVVDGGSIVLWPAGAPPGPRDALLAELPVLGPRLGRVVPDGYVEVLVVAPMVVRHAPPPFPANRAVNIEPAT